MPRQKNLGIIDSESMIYILSPMNPHNQNNENQQGILNVEQEPREIIDHPINPIPPQPAALIEPIGNHVQAEISAAQIAKRRIEHNKKCRLIEKYLTDTRTLLEEYQNRNRNQQNFHNARIVLTRNEIITRLISHITGIKSSQVATEQFRTDLRDPLNNTYQRSFVDSYLEQFRREQPQPPGELINKYEEILTKINQMLNYIEELKIQRTLPLTVDSIQQIALKETELNNIGQKALRIQNTYLSYSSAEIKAYLNGFKIALDNQLGFFQREVERGMPYFIKRATKYLRHGTDGILPLQAGPVRESYPILSTFFNAATPFSQHYFIAPSLTRINNEVRDRIQEASECLDLAAAETLDKYKTPTSCCIM